MLGVERGMIAWTPEMVKQLRLKYRLSQAKLGKLTGVSGNYIYMLEGGERNPSKTLCLLLDRIAKELHKNGNEKEVMRHGTKNKRSL